MRPAEPHQRLARHRAHHVAAAREAYRLATARPSRAERHPFEAAPGRRRRRPPPPCARAHDDAARRASARASRGRRAPPPPPNPTSIAHAVSPRRVEQRAEFAPPRAQRAAGGEALRGSAGRGDTRPLPLDGRKRALESALQPGRAVVELPNGASAPARARRTRDCPRREPRAARVGGPAAAAARAAAMCVAPVPDAMAFELAALTR